MLHKLTAFVGNLLPFEAFFWHLLFGGSFPSFAICNHQHSKLFWLVAWRMCGSARGRTMWLQSQWTLTSHPAHPTPSPPNPPPPPTRAHTQNIHTRMASYWCWHQKLELIALITIVNGLWNLITGRPLQSGGTWKTTGFFGVSVSDSYRFLNNLANSRSTLFGLYGLPKRYLKKNISRMV